MTVTQPPAVAPIPAHVPPELVYKFDQLYTQSFDSDPFGVYEKVRAEAPPIFFSPMTSHRFPTGVWYATKPDHIRRALQDSEYFTTTMSYGGVARVMPRRMIPLQLDPPDSRKYRLLLTPLFSPNSLRRLESGIRETANELIDGFNARGGHCDFARDFAAILPATVFTTLMGYPGSRKAEFLGWVDTFFRSPDLEARVAAGKRIEAINFDMIAEKRAHPDEGLISRFASLSFDDGTPVPDDDIQDMAWLLFIAGLDTVSSGLSHFFRYLAEHPDKKQELIEDRDLIPQAVEELLRVHAWVNPPRTVRKDTELGGVQLKRGDEILLLHTLANRDEQRFPHPLEVDFHRDPNPHTAFGGGLHRCIGSHLARQELRMAINIWLDRAPDFTLPAPERDGLRYNRTSMFSLHHLPLQWTPR